MPSSEAKSDYFSHRVAARLDGPVLRYSQRAALLREAEQLRIGRFEANLIIAKVQHARGYRPVSTATGSESNRFPVGLATFVTVQTLICLGAWWILK